MRKKSQIKRDKSPIIQVNLMKENTFKVPQASRASLNLTKVLENRKQNVNSLWEPSQDTTRSIERIDHKFDNYFQRHSRIMTQRNSVVEDSLSPHKESDMFCNKHFNKQSQQQRKLRYVCCRNQCESHLLCNECRINKICKHEYSIKIEQFLEQPILIFLQEIENPELINGLILQQMQLYNKVKQQAEESKTILHDYFNNLLDTLRMRFNTIEQQFAQKIENSLLKVREDVDKLVQNCSIYKDDFEERCNISQDLIEIIKGFKQNSDNPRDIIIQGVKELQNNLNQIPQLSELILKNKQDIRLHELQYSQIILEYQK